MEALLVGRNTSVAWAVPYLLSRAGFQVDVVMTSPLLRLSRFTRHVHVVDRDAPIADAAFEYVRRRGKTYDWVIVTDDSSLAEFSALERRTDVPSMFVPLIKGANRDHLYSKIGLSRALSAASIRTPRFGVACDCGEAISAAREIGYPVMVKVDASGGGLGVHECQDDDAIRKLRHLFSRPVLIQKKIEGPELDLSAIFLDGELIHFAYSVVKRTVSRFGLSSVRTYYPSVLVDGAAFDELSALGRALGANGFTTISCLDAADGSGRYYIEVDMRPNVWVDFSLYYGEDAAPRIRDWFSRRIPLNKQNAMSAAARAPLTIPYFMRLRGSELLINRYAVWKFIPFTDTHLVRRLLAIKALNSILVLGKWAIPRATRSALQRPFAAAGALLD